MKHFGFFLVLIVALGIPFAAPGQAPRQADPCPEVRAEMLQRMGQLDSTVKVRQAYLLGEISQSGPAIKACLTENQNITSRVFLMWIIADLFLILIGGFMAWNSRLYKKAVKALSEALHAHESEHPKSYQPSQWPRRLQWGAFSLCVFLVNIVALFY
jgi:hypothetical protein